MSDNNEKNTNRDEGLFQHESLPPYAVLIVDLQDQQVLDLHV